MKFHLNKYYRNEKIKGDVCVLTLNKELTISEINHIIAKDILEIMTQDKEVEMSLRFQKKAELSIFIRNNEWQKFTYDQFQINPLEEEDEDFEGMPAQVYNRLCHLIFASISEVQTSLDYKSIIISWNYNAIEEEFENINFISRTEIHHKHRN